MIGAKFKKKGYRHRPRPLGGSLSFLGQHLIYSVQNPFQRYEKSHKLTKWRLGVVMGHSGHVQNLTILA